MKNYGSGGRKVVSKVARPLTGSGSATVVFTQEELFRKYFADRRSLRNKMFQVRIMQNTISNTCAMYAQVAIRQDSEALPGTALVNVTQAKMVSTTNGQYFDVVVPNERRYWTVSDATDQPIAITIWAPAAFDVMIEITTTSEVDYDEITIV